jgi:hypothetical protein
MRKWHMARGWESKSVESQIEDRREPENAYRPRESRDDIERRHKRMSLELSRRQVANDLEHARSGVHRVALEHALRHLDDELKKLSS